ncbi:MAG: glycosyltransferase family 2 protein [Desulfuromonadales bacterium]|nr:glycosyltransferase family 2 protein [Desulfuromonadales bacterium]
MTDNHPLVYLIILNWNGKTDTLECLASVKSIDYPDFEIVIVDNGSTDGSEKAIRAAFPELTYIQTGENLGYAEGNNVGIRYAMESGADYVFVLNNDTTVDAHILSALVTEAEKSPNAAILGPKIYFYDRPDVINSAGGSINNDTLERGHIGYGTKDDGSAHSIVTSVEWTTGCAMLLRVSALREVGLFDPDFFLICEELDLCARVRRRGLDILFVPDAKLWHKVSAAFEGNYSPVYCYYFFRNSLLYARKNFRDSRLSLYKLLLRQSREFYRQLAKSGDLDSRKKGFCILMGTIHFFLGRFGRAPAWVFKVNFPRKTTELVEESTGKDLFKAEIRFNKVEFSGKAGNTLTVPVTVKNLSEATWPAFSSDAVRLSYHLRDENGKAVAWDGLRTTLPGNLRVGKSAKLDAVVQLPENRGSYILEWDLVQESVAWFSSKGMEVHQCKIHID